MVVERDEVLVIQVGEDAFGDPGKLEMFARALDATPLKARYVIFSGAVEFSKVKL